MVDIPQESRLIAILSNDPVFTTEILYVYSISPSEDVEEGYISSESLHSHDCGF